jgi:hypothetical protein
MIAAIKFSDESDDDANAEILSTDQVMFFPYLQWNISSMLFPVYLAHAI